jgi:adenylate cyclase
LGLRGRLIGSGDGRSARGAPLGVEIERRFLVAGDGWKQETPQRILPLRQGYLSTEAGLSVRIRIAGEQALLTIKGDREGLAREEFEYAIPKPDAEAILALTPLAPIQKVRHEIRRDGVLWQVDVFGGPLSGLVMAEVELEREDQPVTLPSWIGREVSHDMRFRNSSLIRHGLPRD